MNIVKIMQQAKAAKDKMSEMQKKLADVQVTGTAGGGAVSVTMTCRGRVDTVVIGADAVDPADIGMLEDLVKTAVNDARKKADDLTEAETRRMMADLGLPSDTQLPF